MYINGEWVESHSQIPVTAPYSGDVIDTVPEATPEQVEKTITAAEKGAAIMAKLTAHDRNEILNRAADLFQQRIEDFAKIVSGEVGKPLTEARGEVGRMPALLRLAAYEGSQLRGETLPIDAQSGAAGKVGITLRVPCGVVVAITPFNYPILLVIHKVAPALAAGNAVILKPATYTPLSALMFTEVMLEAGLPEHGLQCITGSGSDLGGALCSDPRVRKISFTGSTEVGEKISRVAGVKKLSLELGSNSPLIVLPDADLEQVAQATAAGGYVNAGQVCISLQRVLVHDSVYGNFLDALKGPVEAIKVGDPQEEDTQLSAMISEAEARRVEQWTEEAVQDGASIVTGGEREGSVVAPTVVADVTPDMKISRRELFGPAVGVSRIESVEEGIALANDSQYGLGAGIFTQDINKAWKFAREVQSGNVMINWTPLWRADLMPYGGFKQSGIGNEGPRYAVEEMTEIKTVVFHGVDE
jgi:acyl-CoA reductase-like NAD-dependent aldehyde dehydrogenase